MLKRIELLGFEFISTDDINSVAEDIIQAESYEAPGKYPFLITPNVDDIVKFSKEENKYLRDYFTKSVYILPDGQPIVLASKLFFDEKLAKRIPGANLLPILLENNGGEFDILALTSSQEISDRLKELHSNVISYTLPFFSKNQNELIGKITDDCTTIIKNNPRIKIVLVCISFPKQNILALSIYNKLKTEGVPRIPLFCMLGASLEFYFHIKKRAPVFIQKMGFEWLHRALSEPKRLFKRYFVEDMAFFPILYKELKKSNLSKNDNSI